MTPGRQRALLTGGTGFVGRYVLAELDTRGFQTWSLGRRRPDPVSPDRHITLPDPRDGEAIHSAMEKIQPKIVLHLAGTAVGSPAEMYAVNAIFAVHLLAAAMSIPARPRVFLAGSAAEYGPVAEPDLPVREDRPPAPRDIYGITKLAQTLHGLSAAERGLNVVVGRLFNLIGAGMPEHLALGAFAAQIARMGPEGGTLITGDLDVQRDFVEATDAARLIVALVARIDAKGVVDICSGTPTSLRQLVDELLLRCALPIKLQRSPDKLGVTSLRLHFGAAMRLRELGLPVPKLNPKRAISEILERRIKWHKK